ncbi:MAG: bifunctional aconitate hydratase 2/2-methylisocitrate dehydratase [Helicobacter sp.]|nr:bifunctional aconitate hydratase 2/2-methylisocitrate dehydratase [Helicobacter sp.]
MDFFSTYNQQVSERAAQNVPPLPLDAAQTAEIIRLLLANDSRSKELKELLSERVSPGVDEAAKVKAEFLDSLAQSKQSCQAISPKEAITLLGTMLGGYNIAPLINALKLAPELAQVAADALKKTLLIYDAFGDIVELAKSNKYAQEILQSWAKAEWFTSRPKVPEKLTLTVFKIDGETNTDDLSPAGDAFTRSDIPLHAQAMLKSRTQNALSRIEELKKKGNPLVYVGDVVGTGSSRKSACNSLVWHMGEAIPHIPNKKSGGVVIGGVIAPIFFNTCEDSGCLPLRADVSALNEGDVIDVYPYKGEIHKNGAVVSKFELSPNTLADEIRAGGRINLIIGRGLTAKAQEATGAKDDSIFAKPTNPTTQPKGYTLAQKMVGRACGVAGIAPGTYCEPIATTVGSQDTTGPMTRDEIKELASLGFSADFVLQSFCHTAAYPKPADVKNHATLPKFISSRGGVSLRPGDGVIHSWLNRMVLPDTVGTGGDSHTRFPIGISFPAGSGLVAFAAVTGSMPLDMPESVLVRFSGKLQPGITLRDLVNAIPYYAIKQGLLTVEKKGKKNIFNGKILEIEGLPDLKVEQAFELSDASAERSAAACTVALNKEPIIEYLKSNITLINAMIKAGYEDAKTLERRAKRMQDWIDNPQLLVADKDAEYAAVIEINLNDITEPILACPNDPDDVATLSEILNDSSRPKKIDEVFVGSCMTNIGHYRALGEVLRGEGMVPTTLWVAPPTKMDAKMLVDEGYYALFGAAGARIEIPGCSLCMGNQARVRDEAVVFSTSTRNFDNRMGKGAKVYLGSAELGALCAMLGKLPTKDEYLSLIPKKIEGKGEQIYRYLNFNLIESYSL